MPDLNWNKKTWDGSYDWSKLGEEWSEAWGNSETQWFSSLYPRIHRFLPCDNILEIGPGFGRWTKHLVKYLRNKYVGVDLSDKCISFCKKIFDGEQTSFHRNDGMNLSMVEDGSCDFVFSFDSLVHAEIDVFESYIPQIINKLKKNGIAFIHHSNLFEAYESDKKYVHERAASVGTNRMFSLIEKFGGHVIIQESINWGGESLIDAFTLFCKKDRAYLPNSLLLKNSDFIREAEILRKIHSKYCID